MLLYLPIALVAGLVLANQTPINTDLRRLVASPLIAGTISFLVGTVFLALVTALTGHSLFPSVSLIARQPWWLWLGGLLGAIYLTTNVLLFPRLGALQTVILPIFGQILAGVAIDTTGAFDAPQIPLTLLRSLGILVMLSGLLVAVVLPNLTRPSNSTTAPKPVKALILWRLWAIIVGGFGAIQQAINGHLGVVLRTPADASFISFLVGSVILIAVTAAVDRRTPSLDQLRATRPWSWLGGILGALYVLATVLAVPQIGAGLTVMSCLIGQIAGSILVQQYGWWRSPRLPVRTLPIAGVLIMLIGVVIIKFL